MAGKAKKPYKGKKTTISKLTQLKLAKALAFQQQGSLEEAKIIYEDVLKEHPDHFDCYHLLGLIFLQRGDYYEAAKLISKAVDIYPKNPAFFYHLGVALQELGELDGAMTAYDLATAMKPDFTEAWYNWGNALQKREKFAEAVDCYDKALAGNADFAEAHHNRAMALRKLVKYEDALAGYDQAIALKPDYGEAWFGRGNVLAELHRRLEAISSYDHALSLRPDYAEAYLGRATVLQELKKFDEALISYNQVIALKPDHADAYMGRSAVLRELKRFDEALADCDRALVCYCQDLSATTNIDEFCICLLRGNVQHELQQYESALASYDQAIALKPDYAEAYANRGNTLHELQRYDDALLSCDQAIAINPLLEVAYNNRGNIRKSIGQTEAAIADFDQAVALNPDYAEAYSNRGTVFHHLGQCDMALDDYNRAIALNPELAGAQWNKSLVSLLAGQFTEGWKLHEWRWQWENFPSPKRNFPQPLWLGDEPLTGKTILLHSEQGLGDTLQFCRYIPLVAHLGGKIILEVEKILAPLLKDLEGIGEIIYKESTLPDFDCHCPLLSLPLAFKTELHTIPSFPAYLHASPDKLLHWQNKLGEKTKPWVGLVWSGKKIHKNDRNRSIALAELIPYLPDGCQYVSLQKDIRTTDEETLKKHDHILRFDRELYDFSDTAALCTLMDVIVSVDTSVAHLGGALGKPTWILLPFAPDWRWLLDRKDSPWYPSVTLYRQPKIGDWASVFTQIRHDLEAKKFCF